MGASPEAPPAFAGGLLAVSPGGAGDALIAWVEAVAAGGADGILLREPSARPDLLRGAAARALALAIPLSVHERCPGGEALAAALGVTLHTRAHPPRWPLGGHLPFAASTHCAAQVDAALGAGARYATLSPVWSPASKPDDRRPTFGAAGFLSVARGRRILALGGVTPARYADLIARGAYGAAVLGPLRGAPSEVTRAVVAYRAAVSEVSVGDDGPVVSDVSGKETGSSLSGSKMNRRS